MMPVDIDLFCFLLLQRFITVVPRLINNQVILL
jgi:hypothetical protein